MFSIEFDTLKIKKCVYVRAPSRFSSWKYSSHFPSELISDTHVMLILDIRVMLIFQESACNLNKISIM